MATPKAEEKADNKSAAVTTAAPRRNPNKSPIPTKEQAQLDRAWWVIDATDRPLGRLASEVARVLRGKHKPTFAPHVDTGDFVVVVNAGKVKLTGNKLDKKLYSHHSGIPGGFKQEPYRHLIARKPEFPIEKAVKGMLPKNVLGREMFTKLKVYATADHPHAAQKPKALEIK